MGSRVRSSRREVFVVHHVATWKDAFARHTQRREIVGLGRAAADSSGEQADDAALDGFPPSGALFADGGAGGKDDRGCAGFQAPSERGQRGFVRPAGNGDDARGNAREHFGDTRGELFVRARAGVGLGKECVALEPALVSNPVPSVGGIHRERFDGDSACPLRQRGEPCEMIRPDALDKHGAGERRGGGGIHGGGGRSCADVSGLLRRCVSNSTAARGKNIFPSKAKLPREKIASAAA